MVCWWMENETKEGKAQKMERPVLSLVSPHHSARKKNRKGSKHARERKKKE